MREAADGVAVPESHRRIYAVVDSIPEGRVATYGQVAVLAGYPRAARLVGQALGALDEGSDTPWHRVVNARGTISRRGEPVIEHLQRLMLEEEGVELDPGGRIDLERFGWEPFSRPE